jgi:D-3-phosphoglycerate dehydrogenase
MIKILANDGIDTDAQMLLEEAGYQVDTEEVPQEQLKDVLSNYDAVLVRSATKIRKELIDACPKLRLIARGGVGMDNIDVEYAESKGIKVINTPRASSQAVAELSMAHIFTLARSLHHANRNLGTDDGAKFKQLKEFYSEGVELRGKTLGIIGFGRIGQALARMALAMGMNVLPYDVIEGERKIEINILNLNNVALTVSLKIVSFDYLLANSDFISIHAPFSGGKSILGTEQFAKMKDGVFLINTSRGGVIGEQDLLDALNKGKIAGVGLDVFRDEPKPNPALLNHPKISVTPHIGASTVEAQRKIGLELADALIEFFG